MNNQQEQALDLLTKRNKEIQKQINRALTKLEKTRDQLDKLRRERTYNDKRILEILDEVRAKEA